MQRARVPSCLSLVCQYPEQPSKRIGRVTAEYFLVGEL